tara:strand:- start:815 stop:1540 length:726 start_codon:yes stop_codon:yes gene_type:complete
MAKHSLNSLLSITLFVVCLFLAWKSLSTANFFFDRIYEFHALDEQIKRFAPQNRNKTNFEITSSAEHHRIFAEIVSSINSSGDGLSEISYYSPDGEKIDAFLTNDEITHLKDVSQLVVSSEQLILILISLLILFYGFCYFYKVQKSRYFWKPVSTILSFSTMVLTLILGAGIIMVLGPRNVFHILHKLLFSGKGQWFFYYQESLMTTLLPESLFGTIAVMLVTAAFIYWTVINFVIQKILK